jgi:hypothetical protein
MVPLCFRSSRVSLKPSARYIIQCLYGEMPEVLPFLQPQLWYCRLFNRPLVLFVSISLRIDRELRQLQCGHTDSGFVFSCTVRSTLLHLANLGLYNDYRYLRGVGEGNGCGCMHLPDSCELVVCIPRVTKLTELSFCDLQTAICAFASAVLLTAVSFNRT